MRIFSFKPSYWATFVAAFLIPILTASRPVFGENVESEKERRENQGARLLGISYGSRVLIHV